ncbi:sugar ABC transporter permease, partial [Nonomuraea lactucae]|uniref:sugar ABC transporter permease n=1 Tax=Nonomuraea lactucae TaxID=2249762 RepID=UPI000DE4AFF9
MNQAEQALRDVLDRVTATEEQVEQRWPLFADPVSGRWTTTARGSWTGGFWAGLLWLRATLSGRPDDRAAASRSTASLAPWIEADTATRGMIFWYGTALAVDCADATALRERAALACLDAHDPELGLVPWGAAFGGPRELARVDALPGLVRLLRLTGPAGIRAARDQLSLQLRLTMPAEPPRPAWQATPDGTWVPHPDPPAGWSRTVAWLALAVADSGHAAIPEGFLRHPVVRGRFAPGSRVLLPASAARPDGPPDTSAAAIEVVAALKL